MAPNHDTVVPSSCDVNPHMTFHHHRIDATMQYRSERNRTKEKMTIIMGIDVCNWNGNNTCLLLSLFSLPRSGSIFTLIVLQFCFILAWLWTHIGFDRVSNHLHVGLDWKNNGNHHWKSMKKLNGCIENHWRTIGNHWKYKWNHWKSIKANGKHWNSFTNESTSLIIIEKRIRIIEHNWSKPMDFIGIIESGCASEGYFVGGDVLRATSPPTN